MPRSAALIWLLASLMPVGCNRPDSPQKAEIPDPGKAAELKWARGVAEEFLNALLVAGSPKDASAPLTVDYKKRLAANRMDVLLRDNKLTPEERAAGWREAEVQDALDWIKRQWPRTAWSIDSQEIAPAVDEAVFKGTLKPPAGHWFVGGTFVVRVIKEPGSGKWRVDGFADTPQKAKE